MCVQHKLRSAFQSEFQCQIRTNVKSSCGHQRLMWMPWLIWVNLYWMHIPFCAPAQLCNQTKMSHLVTKPTKWHVHPPSLIRVFAIRMKKTWVLSAQADLRLRWAHMPFCCFFNGAAQINLGIVTVLMFFTHVQNFRVTVVTVARLKAVKK